MGGVHVHQHHAAAVLGQDVDAVQLRQRHAQRVLLVGRQAGGGAGLAHWRDGRGRAVGQRAVQRLPVRGRNACRFSMQAEGHLGVGALRGRRWAQAVGGAAACVAGRMAARIAAGITRPGRVRHWCRAAGGGVLRRGGRRGRGALRNGFETAVFRVACRGGRDGRRAARLRQGLADGVRHEAVHGAAVAEADLVT
ncbi:hypothetical protein G6F58_012803 [Rhizopus delemar]|nr:hypothetical protein G6F58_012803 [Rhizopus delemar]